MNFKKRGYRIMVLIIFLGILWLYLNSNKKREGLADPTTPTITAADAKDLAGSFKKQMVAAGIPAVTFNGVSDLFDQLTSLVDQEIAASGQAQASLNEAEATTPVVNTVSPEIPFPDTTFFTGTKFSDAFCKINKGDPSKLNSQCGTLTSENCNATDCCIWVNGTKCVAGDAGGPTIVSGIKTDADYYSYKYECHGNCSDNTKRVYGNNGTVSCNRYCGGIGGKSWNNELPTSWNGAICVKAGINNDQDCNSVAGYSDKGTQCLCKRSDNTPWA
jgi:hypothetical protein